MLDKRLVIVLCIVTGVALELGIHALSGRRESWDSPLYFLVGFPIVGLISAVIGRKSRDSDWRWTSIIVPTQVMTMMIRGGEIGNLWPLSLIIAGILGVPFVLVAFVAARLRPRQITR